ncbi:hypothetical protein RJ640_028837 [Escallonia rubra]|uniref:Uncharacterized protein n=1 Tax=Escallonia rubra TaxID=112253 RepID=A0AA88QGI3_9ASTE|nr:hypothetical protein RJ640_028837 [Escallonia rubra]
MQFCICNTSKGWNHRISDGKASSDAEVEQRGIREAAAEILVKLAGPKHKPLQVASIPGVMESISSLLFYSRSAAASGEISVTSHFESEHHDLLEFVNLGLRLLKKLCCDHGSCEKIGSPEHLNRVKVATGKALSTLTLASTSNCHRILKLKVLKEISTEDKKLWLD